MSYADAWRTLLDRVHVIVSQPLAQVAPDRSSPQLSLFVCPHHDAAHVCDHCPERYETDGWGFVHRTLLAGRTALRRCRSCGQFKPRAEWGGIEQWFICRTCEAAL